MLVRPPPPALGAVIIGSSGPGPARLAFALVVSFVAMLALRGVGVVWHNSAGLDPDYRRGFAADGRYYPVDEVCPVLDQGALEDAVGHGGELTAETTAFEAGEYGVRQGCQLRNNDVTFTFQVGVYPDAASNDTPACATDQKVQKAETVTDGRYTVCRWLQLTNGGVLIADDNAVVRCIANPTDLSSLPSLQPAMQRACVRFMDALARARPARYWGDHFWTGFP